MGSKWFPPGWELDVPNPGYGEISIYAYRHPFRGDPPVVEDWLTTLTGPQIGAFLAATTERAFQPDDAPAPDDGVLPSFVTPAVARGLLPHLQQAIIYAVAGVERHVRTYRDDSEPPPAPYCVNCGQGTGYTPGALPSTWCERHGHTPFGHGAGTRWQTAQYLHRRQAERWEAKQAREGGRHG